MSAETRPSSTLDAASAKGPQLQRERSQQEMEVARHLIEHSQSVSAQKRLDRPRVQSPGRDVEMAEAESPSRSSPGEHHDLQDSLHDYSQASLLAQSQQSGPPTPRSTPSSTAAPSGQACSNCGTTTTPLWRRSPTGDVICNACGLYYKARNQMRPVGLKRGSAGNVSQPEKQRQDRASPGSFIQSHATYVSADLNVAGTCPGGGRCNGTGGQEGCNGCPAYNNRISKTAQVALQQTDPNNRPHATAQRQSPNQTPSATNVVVACQNCGTTITPLWRRDELGNTICNACGLYHKLHGSHRPVQMKKAEIKRRKRIVPVNAPYADPDTLQVVDAMDEDSPRSQSDLSGTPGKDESPPREQSSGAIPVDFTSSFRPLNTEARTTQDPSSFPHKRSSSHSTNRPHEAVPHPDQRVQYNDTPSPAPGDESIDPSLPVSTSTAKLSTARREARRADLLREAEKMRQMLLLKERELEELGDEG